MSKKHVQTLIRERQVVEIVVWHCDETGKIGDDSPARVFNKHYAKLLRAAAVAVEGCSEHYVDNGKITYGHDGVWTFTAEATEE